MRENLKAELLFEAHASLGEGCVWDENRHVLWWLDINNGELHRYDPVVHEDDVYAIGQYIGCAVLRENGGMLLGLRDGIAELDLQTQKIEMLINPEADKPNNRFNDGKCDPRGRFIAGTMQIDAQGTSGSLYSYSSDGTVKTLIDGGIGISNGLAWDEDGKTFYYIDTPSMTIRAYDYDLDTGAISRERVVVRIPEGAGSPDGMTIDQDGMLWVAHYGGWAVRRYNPMIGIELGKIDLPCANVTCCTFGGNKLNTLFITTARQGMSKEELKEQPHAGGIFAIDVQTQGYLPHKFAD